jgi:hypothetical protein
MAKFILKSPGKPIQANGYVFAHGVPTEVRDDDAATLRKLRTHQCFQEVAE